VHFYGTKNSGLLRSRLQGVVAPVAGFGSLCLKVVVGV